MTVPSCSLAKPAPARLRVDAPVVRERKGEHLGLFEELRAKGFVRVRVNGQLYELDEVPKLDKQKKHSIEEVIDLTIRLGSRTNPAIRCGGISLNTSSYDGDAAEALMATERKRLGLPVADPIRGGAPFDALVENILA